MNNHISIATISLSALAPKGSILVIAPHPDDETLGCGGLIALAKAEGRRIFIVVLTDGAASHPNSKSHSPSLIAALRDQELRDGLEVLGAEVADLLTLGLPDGRLADEQDGTLAGKLELATAGFDVETVFAPCADDPHPDHRAAAIAAHLLAGRLMARLWSYPIRAHVMSDFLTAPEALVALDISTVRDRKVIAIGRHSSQLGALVTDDVDAFYLTSADIAAHSSDLEIFRLESA